MKARSRKRRPPATPPLTAKDWPPVAKSWAGGYWLLPSITQLIKERTIKRQLIINVQRDLLPKNNARREITNR
jgi:hypothetical protein